MHRSRTALALGALLPLLLVSACSSDPEPQVAPPTSPTASVSTSPSPTGPVEPVMPEAAKAHTAAGAEAFVQFYWEMVSYSLASGDLGGLAQLSTPECQACNGGLSGLRKTLASGGRITGGETTAQIVKSAALKVHGGYESFVVIADLLNEREVIDFSGARKDQVYPAGKVRARFIVEARPAGSVLAYFDRFSA